MWILIDWSLIFLCCLISVCGNVKYDLREADAVLCVLMICDVGSIFSVLVGFYYYDEFGFLDML